MKTKWKILIPVFLIAILVGAYYVGGNAPGSRGWQVETTDPAPIVTQAPVTLESEQTTEATTLPPVTEAPAATTEAPAVTEEPEVTTEPPAQTTEPMEVTTEEVTTEPEKDQYLTDPTPEGKPKPVEPQDVTIGTQAYTCTISINCATILNNLDLCDPEKVELVPEEGWILPPTTVTFYEGESVFNVLQRTCKQQQIHMEFMNTPIYNSAYIEGIHNLYEFDVGELSGWMYKVNEWFPNYGCSRYQLQDGDVICWVYTCDLGKDVGGHHAAGTQADA